MAEPMTDERLAEITARVERAGVVEIGREGHALYELVSLGDGCSENRWWASIYTQHGHLSEDDRWNLAAMFQHAPTDIRALLDEVARLKADRDWQVTRAQEWEGEAREAGAEVERLRAQVADLRSGYCSEWCWELQAKEIDRKDLESLARRLREGFVALFRSSSCREQDCMGKCSVKNCVARDLRSDAAKLLGEE